MRISTQSGSGQEEGDRDQGQMNKAIRISKAADFALDHTLMGLSSGS